MIMRIDKRQVLQWLDTISKWLGVEHRVTLIIRKDDQFEVVGNDDQLFCITPNDIAKFHQTDKGLH